MELNPITQSLLLTAVVCAVLAAVRPELGFAAIVFLVPFLVSATLVARALERIYKLTQDGLHPDTRDPHHPKPPPNTFQLNLLSP